MLCIGVTFSDISNMSIALESKALDACSHTHARKHTHIQELYIIIMLQDYPQTHDNVQIVNVFKQYNINYTHKGNESSISLITLMHTLHAHSIQHP